MNPRPPRTPTGAPSPRYRVVGLIGRGASARVYEAELLGPWEFRKRVALKVLDVRVDEENLQQVLDLVNEARLGGQLQHPNLVEIYECGQVGDHPYIAMERIDGATLAEVIAQAWRRGGPLPVGVALELGAQVCRGLAYAHSAEQDGRSLGLVHRDLKPANLMVSRHSVLKVMDFGIAHVASTMEEGTTRGTPLYMSPEQVRGDPVTARSDLFCLATVLYETATGRMLFHDTTVPAILRRVADVRFDDRLDLLWSRHPGLATVVARCLRPHPKDRYASAAELGAEIKALLERAPLDRELAEFLPPQRSLEPGSGDGRDPEWPHAGAFTRAFFSRLPEGALTDKAVAEDGEAVDLPALQPGAPPPARRIAPWQVAAIASAGAGIGVALALLVAPALSRGGAAPAAGSTDAAPAAAGTEGAVVAGPGAGTSLPPGGTEAPTVAPAGAAADPGTIAPSPAGPAAGDALPAEDPALRPATPGRVRGARAGAARSPGGTVGWDPVPGFGHEPVGALPLDHPIKFVVTAPATRTFTARLVYRAGPGGVWSETEVNPTSPGRYVCALRPPDRWAPPAAERVEYTIVVRDERGAEVARFGTPDQPLVAPFLRSGASGPTPWGRQDATSGTTPWGEQR